LSLGVNRVDDQRAASDEFCGCNAALQRMFERAGANSLADPIPLNALVVQSETFRGYNLRPHGLMHRLRGRKQTRRRFERQAAWPIAQRLVGLAMKFQEHAVGTRCHSGLGDNWHAFAPATGRAAVSAWVGTGELHRMGGINGHGHPEALHFADTQHVDYQIVVAKRAAALA
jgi:hypothetical protein